MVFVRNPFLCQEELDKVVSVEHASGNEREVDHNLLIQFHMEQKNRQNKKASIIPGLY